MMAPPQVQAHNFAKAIRTDIAILFSLWPAAPVEAPFERARRTGFLFKSGI